MSSNRIGTAGACRSAGLTQKTLAAPPDAVKQARFARLLKGREMVHECSLDENALRCLHAWIAYMPQACVAVPKANDNGQTSRPALASMLDRQQLPRAGVPCRVTCHEASLTVAVRSGLLAGALITVSKTPGHTRVEISHEDAQAGGLLVSVRTALRRLNNELEVLVGGHDAH